jgi:hypothetical protein
MRKRKKKTLASRRFLKTQRNMVSRSRFETLHPTDSRKHQKKRMVPVNTSAERELRLFISSPFRDMQEERDLIVKRVIPAVRKLCQERDISFSYVDLRWLGCIPVFLSVIGVSQESKMNKLQLS